MDRALDEPQLGEIKDALERFEGDGIEFHALRTRQAGQRAFISLHVLVPGEWTVQRGHDVIEEIEAALRERLPYATVFTHLEPAGDPRSFADTSLDRNDVESAPPGGTRTGLGTSRPVRPAPTPRSDVRLP
jgi:divalent metal cation (Fe/Co/Zn/Cd) transporter